jgi:hypothetical protein
MREDKHSRNFIVLMVFMTLFSIVIAFTAKEEVPPSPTRNSKETDKKESPLLAEVENGIHLPTGLIADKDFELIVTNCTGCHAAELVTQNRQNADGWKSIIEWMQEKQNLWDLGKDEKAIIAYLAKNYAPENVGRRKNLEIPESDWYVLEN